MTASSIQLDIETLNLLYNSLDCLLRSQSISSRDYELQDIKAEVKAQINRLENLKKDIIKNDQFRNGSLSKQ